MNSSKKGVTLIEVLVVVAIFAILIAIILPAFNKERPAGFPSGTSITRIDGCQYIESGGFRYFARTHKGNCDNPVHYPNPKLEN